MTAVKKEMLESQIHLTIDRPPVNALDIETLTELSDHLDAARSDDPDAVLLTGSGTTFSAGADLRRLLQKDGPDYVDEGIAALSRAFRTLFLFPRPVVAAINGHALAGGCILAACCDYRVMASSAGTIGAVELSAGVPFPAWALEPLRFAVNNNHLQEIVLFGRAYLPDEALAKGLVDELVPADRLVEQASEAARHLARVPRRTFAATKTMLRRPAADAADASAPETDSEITATWRSPEVLEAVRRTLEALRNPS